MRNGETRTRNPFKLHVHGRGEGRVNVGVVGGQRERESDERCAQHDSAEEVEGRVDMSKADGSSS